MKRSTIMVPIVALVVCAAGYNISLSNLSVQPNSNLVGAQEEEEASGSASVLEASKTTMGAIQILEADEIMKLLVDPTYEDLKDAIEVAPVKRKDWRSLYIAAFNLAELNNLMFSRAGKDYMETEEWTAEIVKARAHSIDLAETVRTRPDHAVLKEKFMVVMQSCNDCHAKFSADEDIDEIIAPLSWTQ